MAEATNETFETAKADQAEPRTQPKPVKRPKRVKKAKPVEETKSWYHLPEYGISVEATSHTEAVKIGHKKIAENKYE